MKSLLVIAFLMALVGAYFSVSLINSEGLEIIGGLFLMFNLFNAYRSVTLFLKE